VRMRPALHKAKEEAEALYTGIYYEAKAKKLALRLCWPRGLNIPGHYSFNST